jgi:hypothetical protein
MKLGTCRVCINTPRFVGSHWPFFTLQDLKEVYFFLNQQRLLKLHDGFSHKLKICFARHLKHLDGSFVISGWAMSERTEE